MPAPAPQAGFSSFSRCFTLPPFVDAECHLFQRVDRFHFSGEVVAVPRQIHSSRVIPYSVTVVARPVTRKLGMRRPDASVKT
jgi:hypothetical protein